MSRPPIFIAVATAVSAAGSLLLCTEALFGGVVLDGSFGTHGALPGPNFMITAPMGRQVNTNLFQSFSQFNLNNSQSATFTGPATVHNILSRVTGGSPSSIDGTINSNIQGTNLFFLNPSGVMFGPHAQLNVSGSVGISTANYLKLAGGGRFNAYLGDDSMLTSSLVSAFGFLNSTPASITFQRSQLTVPTKTGLRVIGGAVNLDGASLSAPGGSLAIISLGSGLQEVPLDLAEAGTAGISATGHISFSNNSLAAIDSATGGGGLLIVGGDLTLDESTLSSVNSGSAPGGNIGVQIGSNLSVVNGGHVTSSVMGSGAGGTVNIQAGNLLMDGGSGSLQSWIRSRADAGTGNAGNLNVIADQIRLSNGGLISGGSLTTGHGGNIAVTANTIDLFAIVTTDVRDTGIFANANADGNGGNITIQAARALTINGAGIIDVSGSFATREGNTKGNAGDVTVDVNGALTIRGGGEIGTDTFSLGKAGDVLIEAGSLNIDGSGLPPGFETGIETSSLGAGNAGALRIRINGTMAILNDGVILADAFSSGKGGNIVIEAASLTIDGSAANGFTGIDVGTGGTGDGGSLSLKVNGALEITGGASINGSGIGGETASSGKGGDLTISASSIVINHDGVILASSFSSGRGGNVTVRARNLTIDASGAQNFPTGITSDASDQGNAGDVQVTVTGLLKMVHGGIIGSSTSDAFETGNNFGNAGDVTVNAGSIVIDGAGMNLTPTGIFAQSGFAELGETGFGNGGNIEVRANDLLLLNGGEVSASSITSGAAGSVQLDLGRLRLDSNSTVSSQNSGTGIGGSVLIDVTGAVKLSHRSSISTFSAAADAGSIDLRTNGPVHLSDRSSITASAGANGGSIEIKAPDLVYLKDSSISATAGSSGGNGAGGNITIDPQFIILNNGLISANAAVGQGGNINLISNFLFNSNSPITATGTTNGTINISAPELDLGAELITLPASLVSAANQLQERCTALLRGDFSSFIAIGRGGIEPKPEELQETF